MLPFDITVNRKNCWSKVQRGGPEVLLDRAMKGERVSCCNVLHYLVLCQLVSYCNVLNCILLYVDVCCPVMSSMLYCSIVLRSIELDHRLTVFLYRAGRNLFLCYPDEMESIAIVCLENFTVSTAWLICTLLYSAVLYCAVNYVRLRCAVQCTMLYCAL